MSFEWLQRFFLAVFADAVMNVLYLALAVQIIFSGLMALFAIARTLQRRRYP
ncbi:MAG: hypothetical protein NZM11_00700 [Anaerolineales bacterium]|nr:hypothetical protein [Anaerolineales bacterium]